MRLTDRGRIVAASVATLVLLGLRAVLDGGDAHATTTSASGSTDPPPASARQVVPADLTLTRAPHVTRPTGVLRVVSGGTTAHGSGPLQRYAVEVETGLGEDGAAFAAFVDSVLADARGWTGSGRRSLQRVDHGPVDFRVVLAGTTLTDRLCAPLTTRGTYSCFNGHGRAVVNAERWRTGAPAYAGDLTGYREYVVNHEVGHALGFGHAVTCGPNGLAQAMQQQTKGLAGCRRNPWPNPQNA